MYTLPELLWEDMLLRSSDGELKEDLTIGCAPTLGTTNGVTKDSSKLNRETAESTTELLEVSPELTEYLKNDFNYHFIKKFSINI
jgi:hypothetical protein